jgi:hypothetical protein
VPSKKRSIIVSPHKNVNRARGYRGKTFRRSIFSHGRTNIRGVETALLIGPARKMQKKTSGKSFGKG